MQAGYGNVDDLLQDGGQVPCDVQEEALTRNIDECGMDKNTNDQEDIDLHSETIQATHSMIMKFRLLM